jgi:hypothetical protein
LSKSFGGVLMNDLKQPDVVSDLSKHLHEGLVKVKSQIPCPAQFAGHIMLKA